MRIKPLAALAAFLLTAAIGLSQGTAFLYQGRLDDSGAPANGPYDLRFAIYDAPTGGTGIGGPLTNAATPVSNGLFTVSLDFGAPVFNGSARWLDLAVRTNGADTFQSLTPRQPLAPTPYALFAANAAAAATAGSVAAANLTGTLDPAQLPASVVTNGDGLIRNGQNSLTVGQTTLVSTNDWQPYITNYATPPLGVSTWVALGTWYHPETFTESNTLYLAHMYVTNGLLAAGWNTFSLDDCWQQTNLVDGLMVADTNRFPHGMTWLVSQIKAMGYSNVGTYMAVGQPIGTNNYSHCCAYDRYPSLIPSYYDFTNTYRQIRSFGSNGFNFVKFDICGDHGVYPDAVTGANSASWAARAAADAGTNGGQPIQLLRTCFTGEFNVSSLGIYTNINIAEDAAYTWPIATAQDFADQFYRHRHVWALIRPGFYDELGGVYGKDSYTLNTFRYLLGYSAISGSPLFAGDQADWQVALMKNSLFLRILRDAAVLPPHYALHAPGYGDIVVRPLGALGGSTNAVLVVNLGATTNTFSLDSNRLGIPNAGDAVFWWEAWTGASGNNWTLQTAVTLGPGESRLFLFVQPTGGALVKTDNLEAQHITALVANFSDSVSAASLVASAVSTPKISGWPNLAITAPQLTLSGSVQATNGYFVSQGSRAGYGFFDRGGNGSQFVLERDGFALRITDSAAGYAAILAISNLYQRVSLDVDSAYQAPPVLGRANPWEIHATTIYGDGAGVTNLPAASVTGALTTNISNGTYTLYITNGLIWRVSYP